MVDVVGLKPLHACNYCWYQWFDESFGQGAQYGLLTLFVIGFGVGAGMYLMYHFVYREQIKTGQRPKLLKAIAFLGLATLAWSVVFILAALIPAAFNPVLPPLLLFLSELLLSVHATS